jgi:protein O-mannosyl-transferase
MRVKMATAVGSYGMYPTSRRLELFALGLVLAVTVCAYLPAVRGAFIWDDSAHVTKPELRSSEGLRRIWLDLGATQQYYPLLHSAFWLEEHFWGENPLGYHLVNLALHMTAVLLVYVVVRKLNIPGALLAAAIFAVHPVMVESVAWVSEQKTTMSAVFYLSAMLAYLRFDESRRSFPYACALMLFILGLLSKTVTATLPGALLVIFWWKRGALSWRRDVAPLVPFFILGAAAGLVTAWVERKLIGAEGTSFELSFMQRTLLAGEVIWFYLAKLLLPINLLFFYPRWEPDVRVWWQWLFLTAAVLMTVVLFLLRHRGRSPLAAWLFFVGTLFPVLGFFNVYPFIYSYVADHFQYLASLGIIVPMSAGITILGCSLTGGRNLVLVTSVTPFVGVLGFLTWHQSQMYGNLITLYTATLAQNPSCWVAHNNLALPLMDVGRFQEAIDHYRQALLLKPDFAQAHNNLGNALIQTGHPEEAIEHYQQALRLKPESSEAHNNLGNVLLQTGHPEEAIGHFQQALRLKPDFAEAHNNLGLALSQAGRSQEAIEHYQQALRLKPNYSEAHNNLGNALFQTGHPQEAIEHYQQAIRLKPDFAAAHNNLGTVLSQAGRSQEAIEHYKQAIRLNPDDAQAYLKLAAARAQVHRSQEAISTAQRAIDIAKSHGQTALAEQIEAWLKSYRAEQAGTPAGSANPDAPSPQK